MREWPGQHSCDVSFALGCRWSSSTQGTPLSPLLWLRASTPTIRSKSRVSCLCPTHCWHHYTIFVWYSAGWRSRWVRKSWTSMESSLMTARRSLQAWIQGQSLKRNLQNLPKKIQGPCLDICRIWFLDFIHLNAFGKSGSTWFLIFPSRDGLAISVYADSMGYAHIYVQKGKSNAH